MSSIVTVPCAVPRACSTAWIIAAWRARLSGVRRCAKSGFAPDTGDGAGAGGNCGAAVGTGAAAMVACCGPVTAGTGAVCGCGGPVGPCPDTMFTFLQLNQWNLHWCHRRWWN